MESGTFKTRLISLLQKSRQAARMYSEMQRSQDKLNYSDLQIVEWKNVNLELVDELQLLLNDFYNQKNLIARACALLERFEVEQLALSDTLKKDKSELLNAVNKNDYAKSAKLSLKLVSLKSRNQALQAVIKELNKMLDHVSVSHANIKKGRISENHFDDFSKVANKKFNSCKVVSINVGKKIQSM